MGKTILPEFLRTGYTDSPGEKTWVTVTEGQKKGDLSYFVMFLFWILWNLNILSILK